jgi:hypothetical protein
MPLPFLADEPGASTANWQIGEVHSCASGCHIVIAQVVAAVAARHDIAWPYIVNGHGWGPTR